MHLVAVFAVHALRVRHPLLDLRLYRRPTFARHLRDVLPRRRLSA